MCFASISSFFKDIPAWGWADILFTAMVLAGVWLESAKSARFFANFKFPKDLLGREMLVDLKHESLKHFGWKLVVWGIAGEVFCVAVSVNDSAKVNQKAGDAWVLAANIGTTNAQLVASNLLFASQVEQLRKTNLDLMKDLIFTLSPWTLPYSSEIIGQMKAFTNITAFIQCEPNKDSANVATSIEQNLETAKWNIQPAPPDLDKPFWDGVTIEVNQYARMNARSKAVFAQIGTNTTELERISDSTKYAELASDALMSVLTNNGILAKTFPGSSKQPVGTVLILVGPKPNPFAEMQQQDMMEKWHKYLTNEFPAMPLRFHQIQQ